MSNARKVAHIIDTYYVRTTVKVQNTITEFGQHDSFGVRVKSIPRNSATEKNKPLFDPDHFGECDRLTGKNPSIIMTPNYFVPETESLGCGQASLKLGWLSVNTNKQDSSASERPCRTVWTRDDNVSILQWLCRKKADKNRNREITHVDWSRVFVHFPWTIVQLIYWSWMNCCHSVFPPTSIVCLCNGVESMVTPR